LSFLTPKHGFKTLY